MPNLCPGCGKENSAKAKFCAGCGARLFIEAQSNLLSKCNERGQLLDNRYEIREVIKAGAMGCVFKALDKRLGELVAVKKMIAKYADDQEKKKTEEMFFREARILARLHHGGLPKVTDFFVTKDKDTKTSHCLVMTFIEGIDLDEYLKKKKLPLPVDEVVVFFRQILKIFSYLHTRKPPVIYRDLKPSNIMIKDGRLSLIDFGIAKTLEPQADGTIIGTPGYASPDQYKGIDSPLNDIYSLGVLMHYLLTGRNPDDKTRPQFVFESARLINPEVPEYLSSLITSMVDVSSQNRPQSTEFIKKLLDKKRREESAAATHTQIPKKTEKPKAASLNVADAFRTPIPTLQKPKKIDFPSYEDFFKAVRKGEFEKVLWFIRNGADVSIKSKADWTALHVAAESGKTDVALLLIDEGADVNVKDGNFNLTPLHLAAQKGNLQIAKLLIKKGADAGLRDKENCTPLHTAAFYGHAELLKLFFEKLSDLNVKDVYDWTPLHLAAANGHAGAARLLLEAGADLNAKTKNNEIPLQLAEQFGHAEVAAIIRGWGKSGEKKVQAQEQPIAELPSTIEQPDNFASGFEEPPRPPSALSERIYRTPKEKRAREKARRLKGENANISSKSSTREMPAIVAEKQATKETTKTVSEDDEPSHVNHKKTNSLREKIKEGRFVLLSLITIIAIIVLSFFAKSHEKVKTPPPQAIISRTPEITPSISQATSSPEIIASISPSSTPVFTSIPTPTPAPTTTPNPPKSSFKAYHGFFNAADKGDLQKVKEFLSEGADVNARGSDDETPLHRAILSGHFLVASILIENSADVNAKNKFNETPLHRAILSGRLDLVKLLIEKGADVNTRTMLNETPLELAERCGYPDVAKIIKEHGGE